MKGVKKIQMSYIKLLDLNSNLRCQREKLIDTGGEAISQIQAVGISTDKQPRGTGWRGTERQSV